MLYDEMFYLSERTRLIGENVLDLTKIIGQIPTPSERRLVCLIIPNGLVEVDERSLNGPHYLNGDVERNRYDVLESISNRVSSINSR